MPQDRERVDLGLRTPIGSLADSCIPPDDGTRGPHPALRALQARLAQPMKDFDGELLHDRVRAVEQPAVECRLDFCQRAGGFHPYVIIETSDLDFAVPSIQSLP